MPFPKQLICNKCYILFSVNRLTKEHLNVSMCDEQFIIKAKVPPSSGLCKLLVGTFLWSSDAQEVKE